MKVREKEEKWERYGGLTDRIKYRKSETVEMGQGEDSGVMSRM